MHTCSTAIGGHGSAPDPFILSKSGGGEAVGQQRPLSDPSLKQARQSPIVVRNHDLTTRTRVCLCCFWMVSGLPCCKAEMDWSSDFGTAKLLQLLDRHYEPVPVREQQQRDRKHVREGTSSSRKEVSPFLFTICTVCFSLRPFPLLSLYTS